MCAKLTILHACLRPAPALVRRLSSAPMKRWHSSTTTAPDTQCNATNTFKVGGLVRSSNFSVSGEPEVMFGNGVHMHD